MQKLAQTSRIMKEVAFLAFFDKRRILDKNGNLLPLADWPEDVAAAVSDIDINDLRRCRSWSKTEALKLLMQYKKASSR